MQQGERVRDLQVLPVNADPAVVFGCEPHVGLAVLKRSTLQENANNVALMERVKTLEAEVDRWCQQLIKRGPQALYAIKSSFAARHSGVAGFSRVAHDLLLSYFLDSSESKELSRSFGEKRDPDEENFYK